MKSRSSSRQSDKSGGRLSRARRRKEDGVVEDSALDDPGPVGKGVIDEVVPEPVAVEAEEKSPPAAHRTETSQPIGKAETCQALIPMPGGGGVELVTMRPLLTADGEHIHVNGHAMYYKAPLSPKLTGSTGVGSKPRASRK
ncbi:unnamed protein product [Amoebophrya sp. A120]|nr:unnamed protein product [Amoebophrya sp. A120]|eukprot:GSA120T00017827001.1